MQAYPPPQRGASLLLAFRLNTSTTLVLGSGPLAASRAFAALEADSRVVVLAKGPFTTACDEIQWRAAQEQLIYIDWNTLPARSTSSTGEQRDMDAFEAYLTTSASLYPIRLVCTTDTLSPTQTSTRSLARKVYLTCKARNIPVNTTDLPDLCDFTFTATHRFEDPVTRRRTPLQVGVTTNGHGCRLVGRVRREIVARLPKEVGVAVERVGRMRKMAKSGAPGEEDRRPLSDKGVETGYTHDSNEDEDEYDENTHIVTPNLPVPPRSPPSREISTVPNETEAERTRRKIKWVAQVSEYWSISKLAQMSDAEMAEVLTGELHSSFTSGGPPPESRHAFGLYPPAHPSRGRLLLVGSGPGHPSLLTLATHAALTQLADLVLADKLVPAAVLALIPSHTPVKIARKFPGNADGAQEEMMREAADAVAKGLCVVRVRLFFNPHWGHILT